MSAYHSSNRCLPAQILQKYRGFKDAFLVNDGTLL